MNITKLFNKVFYNKDLNKKSWRISGVETDPTQTDADNYDMIDKNIDLTITKEKVTSEIIATFNVDNKEYSFILYDEVIDFINELKRV